MGLVLTLLTNKKCIVMKITFGHCKDSCKYPAWQLFLCLAETKGKRNVCWSDCSSNHDASTVLYSKEEKNRRNLQFKEKLTCQANGILEKRYIILKLFLLVPWTPELKTHISALKTSWIRQSISEEEAEGNRIKPLQNTNWLAGLYG